MNETEQEQEIRRRNIH